MSDDQGSKRSAIMVVNPADDPSLELPSKVGKEMKIKLGFWSMLAMVYILMSSWQSYMSSMIAGLLSGGPSAMLYGYVTVWIFTLFCSASIAELLSIWPTASGQIHWAAKLAPNGWGPVVSFNVGFLAICGQVALTTAAAFVIGSNLVGMYILTHPDFVAERYQTVLGYEGILILACLFNIFGAKHFALLNWFAIGLSFCGWLVTIVVMATTAPSRNSASFVFTAFINETGWQSSGVVWILGLLQSAYALTGYDVVAHLSEELDDAPRQGPRALVLSIVVSGLFAIPYLIVVLFFVGDIPTLAATLTGFPYLQLMYDCVQNEGGAIFLSWATTGSASLATFSLIASTSRTVWSFARDGALPFSETFGKVNKSRDVPVNAIILTTCLMGIPGLIYLGNTTAFQAFLSVTVIALNLSYVVPIILMLCGGRSKVKAQDGMGPWNLGNFGPICNVMAIIYCLTISVFLLLPSYQPVTSSNMNYSCVILGLVFMCSTGYWWLGGARKKYLGPNH